MQDDYNQRISIVKAILTGIKDYTGSGNKNWRQNLEAWV